MHVALLRPRTGPGVGRIALARYTLEVAWEAHAKGAFVIGTSLIGGTDTLGVSPFDFAFSGEFDDLSSMLREATARRGRDESRQFVIAGEARIAVKDTEGLLNPENPSSPLASALVDHYQPVRLRGYLPSAPTDPVGIFFGFLEKIEWLPLRRHAGAGVAILICRDLLLWLSEARPIIIATGATTTGAAIGKVLDAIGWVDPSARSLATGDAIPDFSADGTKSGLQLIGELLEAERGVFFVSGSGVATYQDRLARTTATPAATIANQMKALTPSVDRSRRRNRVRVIRTQNDYTATAIDAALRSVIGDRDLEDIETPYLTTDTQADNLAAFVLGQVKSSISPMRDFEIDNRTAVLLEQCLLRELGDVVTITAVGADIVNPSYIIESVEHRLGRNGRYDATWLLSQHTLVTPFRIGTSQLVGAAPGHVLVY